MYRSVILFALCVANFTNGFWNSTTTHTSRIFDPKDFPVLSFAKTDPRAATWQAPARGRKQPPPKETSVHKDTASDEACFSSWYWALHSANAPELLGSLVYTGPHVPTTSVMVYETIQRLGPGTTSTDCEGIPRYKFTGSITNSTSFSVTVTVSRDNILTIRRGEKKLPSTIQLPICTPSRNGCDRLWAAAHSEIGSGLKNSTWGLRSLYLRSPCEIELHCRMGLKEVMLIYWPDNIVSRDNCRGITQTKPWENILTSTFTTDAITFRGQDLYLRKYNDEDWNLLAKHVMEQDDLTFETLVQSVMSQTTKPYVLQSVMRGNWSFTYPTMYLAHRDITAGISHYYGFSVTTLEPAGVRPISTTDIFTMRMIADQNKMKNGVEYARMVSNGTFRPLLDRTPGYWRDKGARFDVLPLNIGDMMNPVPASALYDARWEDCWGEQLHCGTITDDTFRPRLSFGSNFWSSFLPSDFYCADPLVVDPPISLHVITQKNGSESGRAILTLDSPDVSPRPQGLSPSKTGVSGLRNGRPQPGSRVAPGHPTATTYSDSPYRAPSRDPKGGSGQHRSSGFRSNWGFRNWGPSGRDKFGDGTQGDEKDSTPPSGLGLFANTDSQPSNRWNSNGHGGFNEQQDKDKHGRGPNPTVFQGLAPKEMTAHVFWTLVLCILLVLD